MSLPFLRLEGVIERRLLVNFRVDPAVLRRQLPTPFHPKLVRGWAMAGICLIRLRAIRPAGFPGWLGLGSENAAHRVAVEWVDAGRQRDGVFILRRDSDSWWNCLAGGRLFPGRHHRSVFEVKESADRLRLEFHCPEDETRVNVEAHRATGPFCGSVFESVSEASEFFRAGSLGWSPTDNPAQAEGVELQTRSWSMEPLATDLAESSYLGDDDRFPAGSVEFDSTFVMREVEHEWLARGRMPLGAGGVRTRP